MEFGERNIRNFVMRDRNHPCVFLWSVGNEMGDIQWNIDNGLEKLEAMAGFIRKYDPARPVTMVCDASGSVKWRHFDYYDIHCWNYGRRYLPAREMDATKSVIISESASTVSTRGFYELPLPQKKTDFTQSLQVSSYDLNAPEWAEIADDDFLWQQEDKYVAGEFVWTGFDYLGEPTPYNDEAEKEGRISKEQSANSSYFGIVDMCGIPKDRYYLYRSHWAPEKTTVHILPHWNWDGKEGQNIPVFVYTNGDCAELFLNGKSLGKQCKKPDSEKSYERFRLIWDEVTYQPGELKAVAYNKGIMIGESFIKTAGEPYQIKLTPDRNNLKSNGMDLSYILIEARDKNGNPCPLADNMINFEVKGTAVIEGVGNGNPQSTEPFIADYRKLFYGKAMLIIRTLENKPGIISVTATSEGLKSAEASLNSN
jgi:beta-galactosidase